MADNVERELGALQADVTKLKTDLVVLQTKVDEIHTIITKAKGGWLALILIGGAIMWLVQNVLPVIKKVSF
jgi:hypothetical protein